MIRTMRVSTITTVLLAAFAGCATLQPAQQAPLATPLEASFAAPLPSFSAGDFYGYDDGSTQRVVAVTANQMAWRGGDGAELVTTNDLLLPPVFRRNHDVVERRVLPQPDPLFPLRIGKDATFTVSQTAQPPAEPSRQTWHCTAHDAARVQTAIGWFDTIRVACSIHQAPDGPDTRRVLFYAPAIGTYVRREDRTEGGTAHIVQLVNYLFGEPPLTDSALSRRVAIVRQALGNTGTVALSWADPEGDAHGTVTPERPVRAADGQTCRGFDERIESNARRYHLTGTACRGEGGLWQIVSVVPASR